MTIKIISLNIWQGGRLMDNAVDFFKTEGADVILLQEAFDGEDEELGVRYRTVKFLSQRLGFSYTAFKPNHDQPDNSAQIGNAIISRFPIVEECVDGASARDESIGDMISDVHGQSYNLQHVVLETPVVDVDLLNLHGAWDLRGDRFSAVRQEMGRRIIESVKDKKHVILAGDTNAKPTNEAIALITEHLKSVFGGELTTTFNMRHKHNVGYATAAVDMIFVSSHIRPLEWSCPAVDVSDHLPIMTTLEIIT